MNKSKRRILITAQTLALSLLTVLPAQAAILIGGSNQAPGSVVALHPYYQGTSTQPYYTVTQPTTAVPVYQSRVSSPVYSTPRSTAPINIGQVYSTNSGSVVSLKYVLNPQPVTTTASGSSVPISTSLASAPTTPVPAPTPAPAPAMASAPTIKPATALTPDEQLIVNMVNQERQNAGLKPLQVDLRLVGVAETKAADMQTNHYFNHTSPTFGSPWAMMQMAGLKVQWAGENIAGNMSAAAAMAAWMQSSGHRANILDPKFTHIGVGAAYGGPYNIYVQEFLQE